MLAPRSASASGVTASTPAGSKVCEPTPKAFDICSGTQAKVNAVYSSQPLQAPLSRSNVHDGNPLSVCTGWQQADNLQFKAGSANVNPQRIAGFEAEPVGGSVTQKQCFRIEKIGNSIFQCREELGLNLRSAKGIKSDDRERIPASGDLHFALNGRARRLDFRQLRDARIHRLVKAGARSAHHQVS